MGALRFAEVYGVKPWEVHTVPAVWWYRWTMWEQAKGAHLVWKKRLKDQTPEEAQLTAWASLDGKY